MDNDQVVAGNEELAVSADAVDATPPKRPVRTRRKAVPKAESAEPAADAPVEVPAAEVPVETKKAPVRRTRARKVAGEAEPLPAFAEEAAAEPVVEAAEAPAAEAAADVAAEKKPVRRRASRAKAAVPVVDAPAVEEAEVGPPEVPAGAPATTASAAAAPADAPAAAAPADAPAAAAPAEAPAAAAPADAPAAAAPAEAPAAAAPADAPAAAAPAAGAEEVPAEAPSAASSLFLEPGAVTSMLFRAPDLTAAVRPAPAAAAAEEAEDEEGEEVDGRRRRRSRGRRGRSRTGEAETEGEGEGFTEEAEEGSEETLADGVTSRRRRRRRRGDQDLELTGGGDDDPPNTVTRVRAPRAASEPSVNNRVTSVKGSTRLEAKKQRRRESRDTGRRRTVITEAEFLARRESVDRQMIVRQRDDRIQIGVLEDGVLAEHFVSKTQQDSLIGNVYLGKVQNVLPSMEAAFVDIGRGRNAVLYAGEVNWESVNLEGKQRRIENALKSGDSVLVQVTKDPVGHKGARLTSQISLPGRYLVYVPGGSMTGISRKLPDVERNRLKRILKDRLPEDAGVIVRTAAEGASEEELTHDINRLRAQWEGIEGQSTSSKLLAPELLYGEPDLTIKVVRDVFNEDFSKLIVSGEEAWDTIEAYVTYVAPDLVGRLEKWTKDTDIFAAWRIDEQIHKALDRKVFLPSGGSLVIDRTEAMTVVDVNTGKFTGSGGNLEETVTKNNLEAAEEVVRQLRLRDIGGIIVIDFIDMVLESNRDLVLRRMVECLGRDRTKHQVAEVTSLGLVQMTRKRMGTGLLEVFGEQCETCAGRGIVTHDEPVEHRRANTVAAEHYVPRAESQPAARTERKGRRRGRGGQGADDQSAPAAVHAEPTEAERHAKAETTRAALANIAAAAHAAHLHDGEADAGTRQADAGTRQADAETRRAAVEAVAQFAATEEAAGRPAAVLTFGGEQVALPFVEHADDTPAPALTLDLLTEAFAQLGEPGDSKPATGRTDADRTEAAKTPAAKTPAARTATAAPARAGGTGPGRAQGPGSQTEAEAEAGTSRARRGRRNRSASRAQGAANATSVEHREATEHRGAATQAAAGAVHEAKAPAAAPAAAKPAANEPIILGVGVPASEL
ncbi:Rne/Rng family ribonuclease [Arthrobacter sp. RHLT1-20]